MLNHEEITRSVISIPSGGLSDRIKNLLTAIKLAEINDTNIICHWIKDTECNGFFDDYFEPIKNVEFTRSQPPEYSEHSDLAVTGSGTDLIDEKTFMGVLNNPSVDLIRPIQRIRDVVDDFTETHQLQHRIGLHVRRTDWLISQEATRCDKSLLDQINSCTDDLFFLASDNQHSQFQLANLLGNRLVMYKPIVESDELRQTSLEHAVIDMFLLSRCDTIFGTHSKVGRQPHQLTSGFTILAWELLKCRKTNMKK